MPAPTIADVARALGRVDPPVDVAQQQFDGNQKALERLAAGGDRIDDLYEYALDLLYVDDCSPTFFER